MINEIVKSMKEYKRKFINYALNKQALKFGDFTLKSGRISRYFFNIGLFNTGHDLAFLGQIYAAALMDFGVCFDVLFGPAYKGIPIVIATALALAEQYQQNVSYCFNRKEVKNHGEGGILVGSPLVHNQVMLVDDVITAGTAIRESMAIITAHQAILAGAIVALDRQEKGYSDITAIQQVEQDYNCQVFAIITMADLIVYLEEKH